MKSIRIGIVGVGNIGNMHGDYLAAGLINNCNLQALCDNDPEKLELAKKKFGQIYDYYLSYEELIAANNIDAIIICTPHYSHPEIAIAVMEQNKHVLVEKPIGVYTKKVAELNRLAEQKKVVFSIMYNQRTNPLYIKVKELIDQGEIGELRRVNWIITDWYRSQSYYDSSPWRATWRGEGGGVLLNQDPHQLDLWQWLCGMPKRVRSFCYYGKYREIEVEDEVTAYVEYENGATGVFVTSTGETPGTNRFEITGSNGRIIIENNQLKFNKLRVSEEEFNKTYTGGFGEPECWEINVPIKSNQQTEHQILTQNFVDSIISGCSLLAPGEEGINGLMLSNAIHLSSWTDDWVELPIDENYFEVLLKEKIRHSKSKKKQKSALLDTRETY